MPRSSSSDLKMAVVYASEIITASVKIHGVISQNTRVRRIVAPLSELLL
jgi:hypothetical protein